MIDSEEIVLRFKSHPADSVRKEKMVGIRSQAAGLAEQIIRTTPPSREQSLAITALEEAVFWANAAIARRAP